jgi:hypothetical protein
MKKKNRFCMHLKRIHKCTRAISEPYINAVPVESLLKEFVTGFSPGHYGYMPGFLWPARKGTSDGIKSAAIN